MIQNYNRVLDIIQGTHRRLEQMLPNKTFCDHILQLSEGQQDFGNLYLGSVNAVDKQILTDLNIKSVLSVMDDYIYEIKNIGEKVKKLELANYKWIDLEDEEEADIFPHFDEATQFIDACLNNTNVLVHCQAGVSRSSSMVIAYVMRKLNLSLQQANKLVVSKRNRVSPNEGFWKSLQKLDDILKADNKEASNKTEPSRSADQPKGENKIIDLETEFISEKYTQKYANHIVCASPQPSPARGNLFLGQFTALKPQFISPLKVTAILSVLDEGYYTRMKVRPIVDHMAVKDHLWIDIKDEPGANIKQHFQRSFEFIEGSLKEGNVLVHCQEGKSRSASIVIAYLIRKYKVGYNEALEFTRKKRSIVKPNSGFEQSLIAFSEEVLKS